MLHERILSRERQPSIFWRKLLQIQMINLLDIVISRRARKTEFLLMASSTDTLIHGVTTIEYATKNPQVESGGRLKYKIADTI